MHLTPPTLTAVLFSAITLFSHLTPSVVEAHSWAACIDWRPKNPARPAWGDSDGECKGYARRYPFKSEFGALDHASPSRHYQQDNEHPDEAPPCANHRDGVDKGSDETRADPVEAAYGGKWGMMTHTRVGDRLCVRWPAKNHAEDNEDDTLVQINLAEKQGKDPTQKQLIDSNVVELKYKNCGKAATSDRRPCGGCFEVPKRDAGTYLLQWRWELNPDEWYTSCADIQIGDAGSAKRRK
ncbi:hypothetical protein BGX29_002700 [Mortierella sp. GBA35]|nr:hypothetical protein BGX23_008523 [Mortierella sp. AD031]KAF9108177.1 hypothetical protein BGX29_002700 [Mortierella sp. GBA35]KAG0219353.1 hypothetical protein BGX33_003283 [Mortierella sp. NVP41]